MKIIETKVYQFEELSDRAQEKAREWYREGGLDYEWWDSVYDDAERIGLKIESFDTDRFCKGNFTKPVEEVIASILFEHGDICETYKTAKEYQQVFKADHDDACREDEVEDFLKRLLEDYRIILKHELEYLESDEQVDENITANEYTFTADGKRFG